MTSIVEDLDAAVALESLMSEAAEEVYAKVPTKTEQKAAHLAAIKETDIDHLLDMQDVMKAMIDKITANEIDLDNLGLIDPTKAEALMVELLDQKAITALLELRYNMIRAAVFEHINRTNVANKVAYPTRAAGELAVPKLGKRFVREGGKIKAAIDKAKMAELLTPEQYAKVYKTVHVEEQVIEAHDDEVFDGEALSALIRQSPAVMEAVRASVIPAGFTNSSFHVRKLTKKD